MAEKGQIDMLEAGEGWCKHERHDRLTHPSPKWYLLSTCSVLAFWTYVLYASLHRIAQRSATHNDSDTGSASTFSIATIDAWAALRSQIAGLHEGFNDDCRRLWITSNKICNTPLREEAMDILWDWNNIGLEVSDDGNLSIYPSLARHDDLVVSLTVIYQLHRLLLILS